MSGHILIVEDSPNQALKTQFLLEEAGYLTETAENGRIGLEKMLADPPDLVVADILMPVMDGYEMTRHLRSDYRTANIPVIMLTSKDHPVDIIRGLEAGADHFIPKPPDGSFVHRVRSILSYLEGTEPGCLPGQQLQCFGGEIVITESREQILQLLLQSTSRIVNCQAMAILLYNANGGLTLFVLSFQSLNAVVTEQIGERMSGLLSLLRAESTSATEQKMCIVIEPKRPSSEAQSDLFNSFLEVPLIIGNQVVGLMGVCSVKKEAFDLRQVKFLFDMGQKAAAALSRIRMKEHRMEK
ncbi:MAG: response regulator [Candidatus Loosdrechtia sp.]|uniref:response regulator n=1 Tax=Candidatus Loosdrechtia sp. TaxID=3101272 RepID=UPI003A65F944|nr:MAG: response regulator [Candidatus Jettenia sp. AMX2]